MAENVNEIGETFGQKRPPLHVTIKQILERYPDGQIFKEMIQNADDAGATVVQFFVDSRQHGTSGLVKKDKLKAYQGPALISANDAVFSKEDWKGIQSLQQSIKADDPFKVGRFGIGFNSVYHLTDMPSIISGEMIAYLDPQEDTWKNESGRSFNLKELFGTDHLRPFHGIADFNCTESSYNKTLFRLPLRTEPSKLSNNIYSIPKVEELIHALVSEAKFLLLFLRSVHNIEVYRIANNGMPELFFQTKIAGTRDICQKRAKLLSEVKFCHLNEGYNFSKVIAFTAEIDVSVYSADSGQITSHWLVTNQVGSSSLDVRAASVKQKVFPWVGAALEIDKPGDGRIFCFLPMPIDTFSSLPIHVNGTFGLTDDRRNLKWPGPDRKNDATAEWNAMLVKDVIPSCYVALLLASKDLFNSQEFYKAWPDIASLSESHWESLLMGVFSNLLSHDVIFSEPYQQAGVWVSPKNAVFYPSGQAIPEVVKQVLSTCEVKLAQVPQEVRQVFKLMKLSLTEVSAKRTRTHLLQTPRSYSSLSADKKLALLSYCLSDGAFAEVIGLLLLPLSNGLFRAFTRTPYASSEFVYLCTKECERQLLPNLEYKLVDLQSDPHHLLKGVATTKCTQLKELTVLDIPALLDESMPSEWRNLSIVHFPNQSNFPPGWFKMFWAWVKNKALHIFKEKFILPVLRESTIASGYFSVVKLSAKPVVYIPRSSKYGSLDVAVLMKFGIHCCPQAINGFEMVAHKDLKKFTNSFDSEGIFSALCCIGRVDEVCLTKEEAVCLRKLLFVSNRSLTCKYLEVLSKLKIFTSASNTGSKLFSIKDVCHRSLLKTSLTVEQSSSENFDVKNLPSNVILLTSDEYYQAELLKSFSPKTNLYVNHVSLLTKYILPRVKDGTILEEYYDQIMLEVLNKMILLKCHDGSIPYMLEGISFVMTHSGVRKCPKNLYDPGVTELHEIFYSESAFPCSLYDAHIDALRECGLRRTIPAQDIIDRIMSISTMPKNSPQPCDESKYLCAKSILKYIGALDFQPESKRMCSLPKNMNLGSLSFDMALKHLSYERCWLPVLASRPLSYPCLLPWKGEGFNSHLCSLNSYVDISNTTNLELHSLLCGSQIYFTNPVIPTNIINSQVPPHQIVAHLQEVIRCADKLSSTEMLRILRPIYSALQDATKQENSDDLSLITTIGKWIYIKERSCFVSTNAVALSFNPNFRHNLEPYLHKLPDSISEYSDLFVQYGMNKEFSENQIVSVLSSMRQDIEKENAFLSADDHWKIVLAILNWLTESGSTKYCGSLETICVPIDSELEQPQLKPACDVVYTDNQFFKKFSMEGNLQFLHSSVRVDIAQHLGLTALSKKLDISSDMFEDTGQYEPLTTRLTNILRDYKDGLTIVKELLQNADDAEATEINICFDARTHCQVKGELFFPGMADSHGPALIVHNNKVFSDEDFENITKLAAATKQNKHLKIGKFGIGFCSVYHITDVPSFVSRQWLYIFDPTLSHLREVILNPALPGKKLQFTSKFIQKSRQLDPYDNLYGFNRGEEYDGTLFRLPFRRSASELSGKFYTEATALDLCEDIYKCSQHLILFLQHIKTIAFQRINNGDDKPTTLFKVCKDKVSLPQAITPDFISIVSMNCRKEKTVTSGKWMISQQSSSNDEGKMAVSSVACELKSVHSLSGNMYQLNKKLEGEMFCYLPLSQLTGLPVHISCNFAVINNRRGIWSSDECNTSYDESEVKWNILLMENTIPEAYLNLLRALKEMHISGNLENYTYFDLWPLGESLKQQNPWSKFVKKLYEGLSSDSLFYSASLMEWNSIEKSYFLDAGILSHSGPKYSGNHDCILEVLVHLKLPIVDLPAAYHIHLSLKDSIIDDIKFFSIFFSNITNFNSIIQSRNAVIKLLLHLYTSINENDTECQRTLKKNLTHCACIPCPPDGKNMKRCDELIHPAANFSKLYIPSEGMFPLDDLVQSKLSEVAMKSLGLICDYIPWEYVIERANSVQTLVQSDSMVAFNRVRYILEAISSHTKEIPPNFCPAISSIQFLPVMKKPEDFVLKWPGEGMSLSSGEKMMLSGQAKSNVLISGSQSVFLAENIMHGESCIKIGQRAQNILGLELSPSLNTVLSHFKLIISKIEYLKLDWTDKSCKLIYAYLEKNVCNQIAEELRDVPCVWTGKDFVHVNQVCFEWSKNGPYLYNVPAILADKKLCTTLSIKESFSFEDILKAMDEMNKFEETPLKNACQNIVLQLMPMLQKIAREDPDSFQKGKLMLPDENFCLHRSNELSYNDAPWAPQDKAYIYVNDAVPRDLAKKLGVRPARSKFLDKYTSAYGFKGGVAFGQREILTRRIQNIIRDYPLDVTLLKELLQNADDAKASKMYVVVDKRYHKTSSILSEEWSDLQGPAMLVWNDSIFSEKDLEGIQELGLGSKRSEADTIGQYGIGFNVVYHVTDCPSFLSNDETLCIMDPHCRYTPGANELSPGRRFDNLKEGFWNDFPDMKSAYLRSTIDNLPDEMIGGSLFRFPIRHYQRMIKKSEIVDDIENSKSSLSADELQNNLQKWMCKMKEAMLFLNNVVELKLFVINEQSNTLETVFHFKTEVQDSARADQKSLQKFLSDFKSSKGCKSHTIMYPLSISEVSSNSTPASVDKWLIHQGVGDIYDLNREWKYISSVKPRHGIAAPLSIATKSTEFHGQVFCFLPLPVKSDFTVHINGHFILNSTRRELWRSTDIDSTDDKTRWNDNLVHALSASYTQFLVQAWPHYISIDYKTLRSAISDIEHFYKLFPVFKSSNQSYWNSLTHQMYELFIKHNLPVFCVAEIGSKGEECIMEWYPPQSSVKANHVYYWAPYHYSSNPHKEIYPILQRVGMKITPAPSSVMDCFNDTLNDKKVSTKFQAVTRKSIFEYYTKVSRLSSQVNQSIKIEETAFLDITSYVKFTKYILKDEHPSASTISSILQGVSTVSKIYPLSPFSHFLLLTADGKLRKFEEQQKVLISEFSALFPESLSRFLHPDLLEVKYSKSYFICQNDNEYYVTNFILQIMDQNLSQKLKAQQLLGEEVSANITHDRLVGLWKCFRDDNVFRKCISSILKQWALLLTKDKRLFSISSSVLPVKYSYSFVRIIQVLNKIGMPFLDTDVVVGSSCCPSMSDGKCILTNIYQINRAKPLANLLIKVDLDIIISYLKSQVMPTTDSAVVEQVRSLPLFENIDGNYASIEDKEAFIWPKEACNVGYTKWLEGHNAVFIKPYAKWNELGYAKQLSLSTIFVEDLYIRFLLPSFYKMNKDERYRQLEYIKNTLHKTRKHYSTLNLRHISDIDYSNHLRAVNFLKSLKQLKCIGDDGLLHKVCDYCDPKVRIFLSFREKYLFLPPEYQTEEWLPFLRDLELKSSLSQAEFLELCKETANGRWRNVAECSAVLLEHLFMNMKECDTHFYNQVSQIPFAIQEDLSELTWVAPASLPCGQMVKLKGSTPKCLAPLLWTIMPIVKLPYRNAKMEKSLGIDRDPSVADVIRNIEYVSVTQHSQWSLFSIYPPCLECPQDKKSLVEIMHTNLSYLDKQLQKGIDTCSQLKTLPCIPVFHTTSKSSDRNKSRVVLVKPSQVLHALWNVEEVEIFHPFLHCLPDEFSSLAHILLAIGVKRGIELCHIEVVLELAYNVSESSELDLNTSKCVRQAIIVLEKLLQRQNTSTKLSSLYLPDSENKLRPSKSLLYGDTSNYWRELELNLVDVPYFHFNIRAVHYQVEARDLCRLLPDEVKPIGLSKVCKQQIMGSDQLSSSYSEVAETLIKTLTIPEISHSVVCFVNMFLGKQQNEKDLKILVGSYLRKIEVITVQDLKMELVLTESNKTIGTSATDFCYIPGEEKCIFYIDSSLSYAVDDDEAYLEVTTYLYKELCKGLVEVPGPEQEKKILTFVKMCLRSRSESELKSLLQKRGIHLDCKMQHTRKKLGEEIPECWHHRLVQDVYNVFNPMEYVGYEDEDGHFIVAQIAYPIMLKEGEQEMEKKYYIYTKQNDQDGIEVSIFSLYKFLIGNKKQGLYTETTQEKEVAVYDEHDTLPKIRSSIIEEDLVDVLKELCKKLREIWKLTEDLRKRAIRRLFLKWHPDKNEDNPDRAEKVFKFLLKQLEHLEKGEPLDDPDQDRKAHTTCEGYYHRSRGGAGRYYHRYWSGFRSRYNFREWNERAYQQSSSSRSEYNFFRGGGGGGGSGGWNEDLPRTFDYFPFDKDEDEKDIEEGWRWVQQAEAEFKVLSLCHNQQETCSGYGYVCFMSHQLAEKALKGGVCALCGLDGRSLIDHNLSRQAFSLQAVKQLETEGLVSHCAPMEDYYLKTRYPNQWSGYTDIPFDHYRKEEADAAFSHAKQVLSIVKRIMPPLEVEAEE